jgi:uncharacterized protein YjlB
MKITGNYDHEVHSQLIALRAQAVVLIVLGGEKGNGFSVAEAVRVDGVPAIIPSLPEILRNMADSIEEQAKQLKNQ